MAGQLPRPLPVDRVDDLDAEMQAVNRLRKGDPVAWNDYMHWKYPHLRSIANGVLQGRGQLAEDAVQLALLKAYTKLETFSVRPGTVSPAAAFWSWLCRIAYLTALDLGRQETKRGRSGSGTGWQEWLPARRTQQDEADKADLAISVLDIMDRLTPEQQQIARLLMCGVSGRKVCSRLGISYRQLQSTLEHIRALLKDLS